MQVQVLGLELAPLAPRPREEPTATEASRTGAVRWYMDRDSADSFAALLSSIDVSAASTLCHSTSLGSLLVLLEHRPLLLMHLKRLGVTALKTRQKLANELSRLKRASHRATITPASTLPVVEVPATR